MPLGFLSAREGGNRASTRKSGDRPEQSSIQRAVRALGAVFRCDDRSWTCLADRGTAMDAHVKFLISRFLASDAPQVRSARPRRTVRRGLSVYSWGAAAWLVTASNGFAADIPFPVKAPPVAG